MKFTKEIKVGFLAILGIMMSVFSYNYLKGINLFENNRKFTVKYEKVDGLSVSNPVTMNGFKIGKVQKINFNSKKTSSFVKALRGSIRNCGLNATCTSGPS